MFKRMLVIASVIIVSIALALGAGLRSSSVAVAFAPVAYAGATVDGNQAEWSPLGTPIPMYEAGDPGKVNPSDAYLRYDCRTETLNVLVLGRPGFTLIDKADDAWATVEEPLGSNTAPYNGKLKFFTGSTGIDGSAPEFGWIAHDPATVVNIGTGAYGVIDGYEASFALPPGTYSSLVVHVEFAKGNVDGTGQAGTSANVGFGNADQWVPLALDCGGTGHVLPDITVAKEASPTEIPETGGNVAFTFTVTNAASAAVSISALSDDVFGALSGDGDCSVGTLLPAGGSCQFELIESLAGDPSDVHRNTFTATAENDEGKSDTASDDATVTFTDVLPSVSVTKTVGALSVVTGGKVTFTFTVENDSLEQVTIASLADSVFGVLPGDDDCAVGSTLDPGATCSFTYEATISGQQSPGGLGFEPHVNLFTGAVTDDEGNAASDADDATVSILWNGRTPGFWKNNSARWPASMQIVLNGTAVVVKPATLVESIFAVPPQCLSKGVVDLNANKKADTLLESLGYQGGATLCGGAQILLRAGTAAVLNEQTFGSAYPGGASVASLLQAINTALASGSRSTMISVASALDYWNNGIH